MRAENLRTRVQLRVWELNWKACRMIVGVNRTATPTSVSRSVNKACYRSRYCQQCCALRGDMGAQNALLKGLAPMKKDIVAP